GPQGPLAHPPREMAERAGPNDVEQVGTVPAVPAVPAPDSRQIDLEEAIALEKARPSPPPHESSALAASTPKKHCRQAKVGYPDAHDLEGWRGLLRAAKHFRGRRAAVQAWAVLLGGTVDGYGRVLLPDGMPKTEVTDALRSSIARYWRPDVESNYPRSQLATG